MSSIRIIVLDNYLVNEPNVRDLDKLLIDKGYITNYFMLLVMNIF